MDDQFNNINANDLQQIERVNKLSDTELNDKLEEMLELTELSKKYIEASKLVTDDLDIKIF